MNGFWNSIGYFDVLAPRADRHGTDRYVRPSQDRTIDEEQHPPRSVLSDIPPLPLPTMDTTIAPSDQFSMDAMAFLTNSFDTYPISGYGTRTSLSQRIKFIF